MMDEMKSALDRALERADRLGKLSPEEMRRQKEAEYVPIGEGLASRYLEHGHSSVLKEQIDRFGGDEKTIVIQAALATLVASINLENKDATERALNGLIDLKGTDAIEAAADRIMGLFGQYAWEQKLWYEDNTGTMGKAVADRLETMGVGGSAIGEINLQTSAAYQKMAADLAGKFGPQLEEIKRSMAAALGLT